MQSGVRAGVVGQGPRAAAVVQALGRLAGVGNVRQIINMDQGAAGADVIVEMVGGVEPAFRTAMAALGGGTACIVTSPMLAAVHGNVLRNAALGQQAYLGLAAAGMGIGIEAFCAPLGVRGMTAVWGDGARLLLARMAFRAESFARLEEDFKKHDMDLSDAAGKLTQARAAALMGAWCGVWPKVSGQVRVAVDAVEPQDFRRVRDFGLGLTYGATLDGAGFYTGPLAVAQDSALLAGPHSDVLVMQGVGGETTLVREVDEEARVVQGVLADMVEFMRRKPSHARQQAALARSVAAPMGGGEETDTRCYVRVPFGRREALLANVQEVLSERVEGDGTWQAVVGGIGIAHLRLLASDGLALPLAGAWTAPPTGLRLVG